MKRHLGILGILTVLLAVTASHGSNAKLDEPKVHLNSPAFSHLSDSPILDLDQIDFTGSTILTGNPSSDEEDLLAAKKKKKRKKKSVSKKKPKPRPAKLAKIKSSPTKAAKATKK